MPQKTETSNLWVETPLLLSSPISARLGVNAYLKLENVHPSFSFKYRGISHFVQHAIAASPGKSLHLLIASGGNAGLAAACAAKACDAKCTVFLPEGASESTIALLQGQAADVVVHGRSYVDALAESYRALDTIENAVMVPAYDDKTVWEGHASMVHEIQAALPVKPAAIFCSVGGGGLLAGILKGCKDVGWSKVPVVAIETTGSTCFYQSMALNGSLQFGGNTGGVLDGLRSSLDTEYNVKVVELKEIASRASSLGATSAAAGTIRSALDHPGGVHCVTVPDELSMDVAGRFADEHKILVELACSATLGPAYFPEIFSRLRIATSAEKPSVVFIVCGGFRISLDELAEYRTISSSEAPESKRDVFCDGERWSISR